MSLKDVDRLIRELAMSDRADGDAPERTDADAAAATVAAATAAPATAKPRKAKVSVRGGAPAAAAAAAPGNAAANPANPVNPDLASTGSTSMLEMRVNTAGEAGSQADATASGLRVAGAMPMRADSTRTERVPQRVRVEIVSEREPTQEEEDAADLKHYLGQVGRIIEPVLICIFIVVWWVKVDQSGGVTNVSSIRCGRAPIAARIVGAPLANNAWATGGSRWKRAAA